MVSSFWIGMTIEVWEISPGNWEIQAHNDTGYWTKHSTISNTQQDARVLALAAYGKLHYIKEFTPGKGYTTKQYI
jgi:hypothetical protein